MSHERLGYLVLGIILSAAVVYGILAWSQGNSSTTAPQGSGMEAGEGETPPPSPETLDEILSQLPTTERSTFDPASVEWVGYTDGVDRFRAERPRGWDVVETALEGKPAFRRILLSEGIAAFAIFPRGEFDVGLPARTSADTALVLDGKPATMREWFLPDGSWLAVVTLDTQPKNGFRIELSTLQPNPVARAILREMLNRFQFLE